MTQHINPGTDTTINPVIINDTHRERQHSSEHQQPKEHCEHECVCLFFDHDSKVAKRDGTPCMRNAKGCANCCHDTRSRPHPAPATEAQQRIEQKFNSTELLLLAHDEWKRREERKHNHENAPWVSGFINGFCTDKKWAREYIDALLQAGRK